MTWHAALAASLGSLTGCLGVAIAHGNAGMAFVAALGALGSFTALEVEAHRLARRR